MNNADIIYQTSRQEGAPDVVAKLIISQSQHETGNWTSTVFKDDHNGFGMKVPSIRKDPYIKGPSVHAVKREGGIPYAHYDNLADSTRSLIHWIKYNKIDWADIDTPEKYADVFKRKKYYGDALSTYTHRLSVFYNQIKDTAFKYRKQIGIAIIGTVLITLGIFIYAKTKK